MDDPVLLRFLILVKLTTALVGNYIRRIITAGYIDLGSNRFIRHRPHVTGSMESMANHVINSVESRANHVKNNGLS